jgi:predicted phosphodiesterase
MKIGVISDTHGLLGPEAVQALQGVDLIIHAGDVGHPEILTRLKQIAPVFAVRGNVDTEAWAQGLPLATVISGHTHRAEQLQRNGVVYLNPGSAGPRRFDLPATLVLLDLAKRPWNVEFIRLVQAT